MTCEISLKLKCFPSSGRFNRTLIVYQGYALFKRALTLHERMLQLLHDLKPAWKHQSRCKRRCVRLAVSSSASFSVSQAGFKAFPRHPGEIRNVRGKKQLHVAWKYLEKDGIRKRLFKECFCCLGPFV